MSKEYAKEFMLRLDENEASELEKLTIQFSQNQSQVVRLVLMNHRKLEREIGWYKKELAKTQNELDRLKKDLRTYFESEANLRQVLRE